MIPVVVGTLELCSTVVSCYLIGLRKTINERLRKGKVCCQQHLCAATRHSPPSSRFEPVNRPVVATFSRPIDAHRGPFTILDLMFNVDSRDYSEAKRFVMVIMVIMVESSSTSSPSTSMLWEGLNPMRN